MRYSLRKYIPIIEKMYIKEEEIDLDNDLNKKVFEELKKAFNDIINNPKINKYMVIANLALTLSRILRK